MNSVTVLRTWFDWSFFPQNGEYEKAISEMKKNCKQLEEEVLIEYSWLPIHYWQNKDDYEFEYYFSFGSKQGSKMRLRIMELEEKLSNMTQKCQEFEQKVSLFTYWFSYIS